MSAEEIIEQNKVLPSDALARLTKFVVESDDSSNPEDFKQRMADFATSRSVDLGIALKLKEAYQAKP